MIFTALILDDPHKRQVSAADASGGLTATSFLSFDFVFAVFGVVHSPSFRQGGTIGRLVERTGDSPDVHPQQ